MPEWTPADAYVRNAWAGYFGPSGLPDFDRWLAAHDAEVRAPLEARVEELRLIANVNGDWNVKYAEMETRAEAAEAKVRAAEALAADNGAWKGDKHVRVTHREHGIEVTESMVRVSDLRAALANPTPDQ